MADNQPFLATSAPQPAGANPRAVAAGLVSTYNFDADPKPSSPDWSPSTTNSNEPAAGAQPSGDQRPKHPTAIGRYQIEGILGESGFGRVYLAHDDQLKRGVAIKVPHGRHVASAQHAAHYLAEAQTLASLDHPHIVLV